MTRLPHGEAHGDFECPDALQITVGPQTAREFLLTPGCSYVLGRSSSAHASLPSIDLAPDALVSRHHARLSFFDGGWWIEDCGSRHGTRVLGKDIRGLPRPTRLWTGIDVEMGETLWTIAPSGLCSARMGSLAVELRIAPAITYAIYHCGIPVVSDLVICNSDEEQASCTISVAIRGYSDTWQHRIDRLLSGEVIRIPGVPLELDLVKLEGLEGRRTAQIEVRVDETEALRREIDILGFYEWPLSPAFRKSLACFVQPAHPVVLAVVAEASPRLIRAESGPPALPRRQGDEDGVQSVEHLYCLLAEDYDIRYARRPPSCERRSQTVRPPHRILPSSRTRRGEATCLDLALFMASCLESMDLQPLVVLVREDSLAFHAMVGWWALIAERVEPVITDAEFLAKALERGTLLLLEPTGFTDRFVSSVGRKLTFGEAREQGMRAFSEGRFTFALDIAAARSSVTPLQLPMDEGALRILRGAEELARAEGSPHLETRHLAWSLVEHGGSRMTDVMRQSGAAPATPRPRAVSPEPSSPRPTVNYRRCLDDAKIAATDGGTGFVGWEHLLYAALLSPSRAVDEVFQSLGTCRDRLRCAFEESFPWPSLLVQTRAEAEPDLMEGATSCEGSLPNISWRGRALHYCISVKGRSDSGT